MKTNQNPIIAILGVKGAGKDTYFNNVKKQNAAQIMFAGILKEVAQMLFPNVDIEDRVIKETKCQFDTLEVDTIVRRWTLDFSKNELSNWQP